MKTYLTDRMFKASSGIANAIFVTIGIGLLLETIGNLTGLTILVIIGTTVKMLMAPAIGAGIAIMLGGNTLTIFSAMAAGTIGAGAIQTTADGVITIATGEPIGCLIAATIAIFVGKRISGKTPLDMMAIPIAAILVGGIAGYYLNLVIAPFLSVVSALISASVADSPVIGAVVISVVGGLVLMSPASSAAIAIALNLDPVSSGAMLVGTTSMYIAFSFVSIRQNNLGGFLAQFVCTPKVQLPNIIKNPRILIGPTIAAAVAAPISTVALGFTAPSAIAGIGFCSLIAPLNIFVSQGIGSFVVYIITACLVPIAVTLIVNKLLEKASWLRKGDMALVVE
ncbi:PTS transporter subunit IIC [Carnobacterium pleistocenium]|uniref:PTS transporter subunit IIC n=1 Tax=Carnobacterium pleistocenium TaxID=181073 RepID=UPI000555B7A8|nr:PTS sugar transporter subunit IIC [Carnobacterium pleistocenium]